MVGDLTAVTAQSLVFDKFAMQIRVVFQSRMFSAPVAKPSVGQKGIGKV